MRVRVRHATEADAEGIAHVHSIGIAERLATLDTEPRQADDVVARLRAASPLHPTVVAVTSGDDGDAVVLGAAWLSPYSTRPAYDTVAEFSVYLDPAVRGRGVGTVLLGALLQAGAATGVHKVVGRVLVENAPSLALLARVGFAEVGVHRRHGRLDGRWRDVVVVERLLDE